MAESADIRQQALKRVYFKMSINMICLPAGDGHREGRHGPHCVHEITEASTRAGAGKKEAADQSR